jgi:hypothetical protein
MREREREIKREGGRERGGGGERERGMCLLVVYQEQPTCMPAGESENSWRWGGESRHASPHINHLLSSPHINHLLRG